MCSSDLKGEYVLVFGALLPAGQKIVSLNLPDNAHAVNAESVIAGGDGADILEIRHLFVEYPAVVGMLVYTLFMSHFFITPLFVCLFSLMAAIYH